MKVGMKLTYRGIKKIVEVAGLADRFHSRQGLVAIAKIVGLILGSLEYQPNHYIGYPLNWLLREHKESIWKA